MNGKEFIRRTQTWAKAHGYRVLIDASRGEGGHQRLSIDGRWTTIQTGELKPGVFNVMLKQPGIPKEEF